MSADYCVVRGWNTGGYPMPDGDNGYLKLTYGDSGCKYCGIGKKQQEPFRIRKIPNYKLWGLEWVHDELFVDADIYRRIFEPLGINCISVHNTTGNSIDFIMQLQIPEISENLNLSDYPS